MQHFIQINDDRVILKPANEAVFEETEEGLVEVDQTVTDPTFNEDNSLKNMLYY
jgi:hypothetical protein